MYDSPLSKTLARARLAEKAARLLRDHVAGENVDDLMHHWADEWDALTGESHRGTPACECGSPDVGLHDVACPVAGETPPVIDMTNAARSNDP